jgi:hypothetical protein
VLDAQFLIEIILIYSFKKRIVTANPICGQSINENPYEVA